METLGRRHVDICPWALREGILLSELDALGGGTLTSDVVIHSDAAGQGFPHLHTVPDVGA